MLRMNLKFCYYTNKVITKISCGCAHCISCGITLHHFRKYIFELLNILEIVIAHSTKMKD